MTERYDSLGRHIPKELEVTPRQFVVAVGREAKKVLQEQYGLTPSRELIISYVQKLKLGTPEHQFLMDEANRAIRDEYQAAVNLLIEEGKDSSEAQRLASTTIRKRYEKLDRDPTRNFSFLDPILITD